MSPEHALKLGVNPADVAVHTRSDRLGGAWLVTVPDDRRADGEEVLAMFAARDPWGACRWRAKLDRRASRPEAAA